MSVLCAFLRTGDFQDVPIGLRGAEISTKNFSQGVLITWLYQLVAAKIVLKDLLAGDGVRGGLFTHLNRPDSSSCPNVQNLYWRIFWQWAKMQLVEHDNPYHLVEQVQTI